MVDWEAEPKDNANDQRCRDSYASSLVTLLDQVQHSEPHVEVSFNSLCIALQQAD